MDNDGTRVVGAGFAVPRLSEHLAQDEGNDPGDHEKEQNKEL